MVIFPPFYLSFFLFLHPGLIIWRVVFLSVLLYQFITPSQLAFLGIWERNCAMNDISVLFSARRSKLKVEKKAFSIIFSSVCLP